MKNWIAVGLLVFFALGFDANAKPGKKHGTPAVAEHKISAVSGASITLTLGTSGDQHETYRITSETLVKLNGAKADAHDLRAGMVAKVVTSKDQKNALSIEAKDAPRHPKKGRLG